MSKTSLPSFTPTVTWTAPTQGKMSIEKWESFGPHFAKAHRQLAFQIGDWLNYGVSHFDFENPELPGLAKSEAEQLTPRSRVPAEMMARVRQITGLDIDTLQEYSMTARLVRPEQRNPRIAFEFHRIVCNEKPEQQVKWLKLAEKEKIGSRKLRQFVQAGRVLTEEELKRPTEKGKIGHSLFVLYGLRWWASIDWRKLSEEQKAVIRHDIQRLKPMLETIGL